MYSFNLEEDTPIAIITDGKKRSSNIYSDKKYKTSEETFELSSGKFLPDLDLTNRFYITAMSNSGKSTFCYHIVNFIQELDPSKEVIIFSDQLYDKKSPIDSLKNLIRLDVYKDYISSDISELQDDVVIFDDIDSIADEVSDIDLQDSDPKDKKQKKIKPLFVKKSVNYLLPVSNVVLIIKSILFILIMKLMMVGILKISNLKLILSSFFPVVILEIF